MASCQEIKTLSVICDLPLKAISETIISPIPAAITVNPTTGVITGTPSLTPIGQPVLNTAVLPNGDIITYGWVVVMLNITDITIPVHLDFAIPLQVHGSCPGALQTDTFQYNTTFNGGIVYTTPIVDTVTGLPTAWNLHLKVDYSIEVIVIRDTLINVALCPTPLYHQEETEA